MLVLTKIRSRRPVERLGQRWPRVPTPAPSLRSAHSDENLGLPETEKANSALDVADGMWM